MSATLNLSDEEVKVLYDMLVQTEKTTTSGDYADAIESMKGKVEVQL